MKTTIDLPDELVRDLKIRAAQENRRYKDVVTEVIRLGLHSPTQPDRAQTRVQFPLIKVPHAAREEEEITPGRVAEILLDEDARAVQG